MLLLSVLSWQKRATRLISNLKDVNYPEYERVWFTHFKVQKIQRLRGWQVETSLEWQEYFSQFQHTTDALPCHIHLPVCLWLMDPHSRTPKKNTSHGIEVLPQDSTHLMQRPCYRRGSPCQDPAGNRTTRRPDLRKETHAAVIWTCLPFIRSGQNHLARHS